MATRYEVEVKVTSATDLKNVNWRHGPNMPYAVVWVDPDRKVATRVDEEGDTCPRWDQTLVIPLDRPIEDATLHIDIVHAYAEEDTKPLIGSTKLPLKEITDDVGLGDFATCQLKLKRPSGRPHGKVDVQVSVRDARYNDNPYHAPPQYGVRDAPPYGAPPASGYPYGGQPAYGAPQQTGYSYGQPVEYRYGQGEEEKKKGKFGGMGTGLAVGAVAGVLGGIALAEGVDALEDHVADEAAERVEDDGGFDDDDGGDW